MIEWWTDLKGDGGVFNETVFRVRAGGRQEMEFFYK